MAGRRGSGTRLPLPSYSRPPGPPPGSEVGLALARTSGPGGHRVVAHARPHPRGTTAHARSRVGVTAPD